MVQPRAGQGAVQIALRLPADLRDRVRAAAEEAGRSVNSEIVRVLEEQFPADLSKDPFIKDLMNYVASAPDREAMEARLKEANGKLRKSRFGMMFTMGIMNAPTMPDGSLESCPALFEILPDPEKGPGGRKATLSWWISKHLDLSDPDAS